MPDPLDMTLEMADAAAVAKELRALLREALPRPCSPLPLTLRPHPPHALSDKARIQLGAMGIRLGDRVLIAGQKVCVVGHHYMARRSHCHHRYILCAIIRV